MQTTSRSNLLATGSHASKIVLVERPAPAFQRHSRRDRADAMDPELRHRIEERAYALWEANGRPEGRDLDYWLQAEREIVNYSMAGE